jgi:hypothetical protein
MNIPRAELYCAVAGGGSKEEEQEEEPLKLRSKMFPTRNFRSLQLEGRTHPERNKPDGFLSDDNPIRPHMAKNWSGEESLSLYWNSRQAWSLGQASIELSYHPQVLCKSLASPSQTLNPLLSPCGGLLSVHVTYNKAK